MRQRAAKTERLMSLTTLAAGAAHELSTPLATIALASRELEHAADARGTVPDLAEDARLIRAEVDRCQAILDQMSGRAGGATADDPEPIDPATLVAEIRARLSADQSARLQVRLPEAAVPVLLPRAGLSQAVFSLVKNAFDATAGEMATPVVIALEQERGRLRVTVADQGAGHVARNAGPNRRAVLHDQGSGPRPRTGALPHACLRGTRGRRPDGHVEQRDNSVSRAADTRRAEPCERLLMTEISAVDRVTSRTLLVVDDDGPFRTRLVRAFAERGFAAAGAADYEEALAAARLESPEYAVVDLRLPGGSGLDLVRELKSLDGATNVLVLTGYGSIATAVQSVRLGATGYLTKPVDADQILAAFEPAEVPATGTPPGAVQPLARVEWEHIQRVLADCDNNISQAARLLGLHRRSLQRKLLKNPVPESE